MFLQMDLAPELSRRLILMAYLVIDTAQKWLQMLHLIVQKGLLSSPAAQDSLSESI